MVLRNPRADRISYNCVFGFPSGTFPAITMIHRRCLLLIPALLTLSGCGSSNSGTADPGTPATPIPPPPASGSTAPAASGGGTFTVGLLTNGSLSDSGWNSLAGAGLKQMETELGAKTSHQSAGAAEAEESLRGFAREKTRLVFAHGSEYGDAAKRVAAEYPDTIFVVSSGEVQGDNVASLKFDLGEAAYLAGMAAAALSKSGKAGQIGGESFPPVKQAFELFEKGGKAINPKFSTSITYLGNWSDANAAKEKALGFIRAGADILFQNADAAGEGVFLAAEENRAKNVIVIGSNANQNDLKPEVIAASAVLDVAKTFMTVARDVQGGKFKGGIYLENLKSSNVYLAINEKFKSRIPADVQKKIQEAEAAIRSGALKLTSG